MTAGDAPRHRENAFALARRLVTGGIGLARLELQRGRLELQERLGATARAAIFFAVAVAFALMALIAIVVLVVAIIAIWLPLWLAALIAIVVFVVLGALFAFIGRRTVRSPVPEETIAAVKEDIEWAKRLLRRE
jgi:uncharacterized membrane protein YqjE